MRILVSWLREFVDARADPAALADILTMRGFEVASIEEAPAGGTAEGTGLPRRGPQGEGGTPDAVIDLEITANRPDCLSVVGIAREVATACRLALRNVPSGLDQPADRPTPTTAHSGGLTVVLEDADRCPRYAAAVADVTVAPSPDWLANRLIAAGVRPINNVVDVTNYVLIELGHPLHAFDLARLAGSTLRIRTARSGEEIRTLDGEQRKLDPDMLVIADADSAQAIAGVMGGAGSEVWGGTKTIAIESAYFKPTSVRRTSKRVGLKTEASARFERGTNIDAPVVALLRACELLEKIGAGRRRGEAIDCYPAPRQPGRVVLRRARIRHLLGLQIEDETVGRVLTGLGFRPQHASDGWQTTVPGWRVDVTREVDLIEEVARHDGYDRVPNTFPPQLVVPARSDPRIERDGLLRRVLTAAGFSEAQTFVFIDAPAAQAFGRGVDPVPIAYPLSENFAVLRPSLLPGVVDSIAYNRRRERRDVRLFEIGSRFSAEAGEHRALAFGWTGSPAPEHWSGAGREVDFFDVKGVAERIASVLRVPARFVATTVPFLAPGRTASIMQGDVEIGIVGQLAPSVADARHLPAREDVYVAEFDLDRMPGQAPADVRAEPLPRYPSVTRDLSIVVTDSLPAEAVRGTIVAAAPPTLVALREFDRYQGKGIPEGQVSISFHLTFRAAERTLTDAEVQGAMEGIVASLAREHRAVRR